MLPDRDRVLNTTLLGDDIIISQPDPDGTGPLPIPREKSLLGSAPVKVFSH